MAELPYKGDVLSRLRGAGACIYRHDIELGISHYVSQIDHHPNAAGHQVIAEEFQCFLESSSS